MAWVPFHTVLRGAVAGAWSASHRRRNAAAEDSTASTRAATTGATAACVALLALGVANLVGGLALGAGDTASTRAMLEAIHANFTPFGWAMLVCASAALAPPGRGPFAAAGALCVVALGGLTVAGLVCVCYQAARGAAIDPTLYLHGLYFNLGWPALHLAALGACVQTVLRRPWLAAAITAASHLALNVAFDHSLLAFGAPVSPWSAMNGYGPYFWPHVVAGVFWSAWSALLLIGAKCWHRKRTSHDALAAAWVAVVVCGLSCAWTVRNAPPEPAPATPTRAAQAQPTYTRLDLEVEFEAHRQRIRSRGTAVVVNQHDVAIPVLRFAFDSGVTLHHLRLTGEPVAVGHPRHRSYRLNRPLAPKETLKITFDLERFHHPFDRGQRVNGASAALADLIPSLGPVGEATVALRVQVGTSLHHTAVAPGRQTGEWSENGQRLFAFAADAPVRLSARVHSGRYATARTAWEGVAITVYHHPAHAGRVPGMVRLAERTLARWMADGTYPHRWLHLVEAPDYRPVAQPPSLLACGWRRASAAAADVPRLPTGVWVYSEHPPSASESPSADGGNWFSKRARWRLPCW